MTTEKKITDLTPEDLVKKAEDNNLWLNGFKCINPTDEFLAEIGRTVIKAVQQSDMVDEFGASKIAIMTVNIS